MNNMENNMESLSTKDFVRVGHFPFKELPRELREMVFIHALALPHDNKTPNFLVVLAGDADKEHNLYEEAAEIYHHINANVTAGHEDEFRRNFRTFNRMKLRHLKVVLPAKFRAQPIMLQNNLESITIDESQVRRKLAEDRSYLNYSSYIIYFALVVDFLVPASRNLRKISLKIEMGADKRTLTEVGRISGILGIEPTREPLSSESAELIVWEVPIGKSIQIKPR